MNEDFLIPLIEIYKVILKESKYDIVVLKESKYRH